MKKRTKYIVFYLSATIGLIISWFKPAPDSPFVNLWASTLLILGLTGLVFAILLLIPTNKRERAIARAELRKELENYGGFGSLRGGMFN